MTNQCALFARVSASHDILTFVLKFTENGSFGACFLFVLRFLEIELWQTFMGIFFDSVTEALVIYW